MIFDLTYSFDLEGWGPFVLQDIKTDTSELVNVWMVDFGSEKDFWSDHGILIWQIELELEHSTFIWTVLWA